MYFFHFYVYKIGFLVTFCVCIFLHLFNRSEISINSAFIDILLDLKNKIKIWVFLAL
jgi:hypothetical protein